MMHSVCCLLLIKVPLKINVYVTFFFFFLTDSAVNSNVFNLPKIMSF